MPDIDQATILKCLYEGMPLSQDQANAYFDLIFDGDLAVEHLAATLIAMRIRGETPIEIIAGAKALRKRALTLNHSFEVMDTCGTGGDHSQSYNISTTVAFVLAGAGIKIAKHGGRASSSLTGSSDVLTALGVPLTTSLEASQKALDEAGICFLFAPNHHPAMKKVAPIRQTLKVRTIFNLLGPLANPAHAQCQIIGVSAASLLEPFAQAVIALNIPKAAIIHGSDGFDEVSLSAPTDLLLVKNGRIDAHRLNPSDFGLEPIDPIHLKGGDADHNAVALRQVLNGATSAYRDVVLANAACGLWVNGLANNLSEGVAMATQSIDQGLARKALETMIAILNQASSQTTDALND